MRKIQYVSRNTVCRLPKYLHHLQELQNRGINRTSSSQMADALGMTASQLRQDLSQFGNYGAQGYGYDISRLSNEIRDILGVNRVHKIAVVGVGSIGRALLEHMDFAAYNYEVCAAFDIDPAVVGTTINHVTVKPMHEMNDILAAEQVDICMLTVSKSAAKTVGETLYDCGVPAIWNFTNTDLGLDETEVAVQNVDFIDSLLALTFYLENKQLQNKAG